MTTFYLDFEGGNDANDGTTFANRWKTISGGATAVRTAPGDEIRVMATKAPTLLGNCAWTDKGSTVTLPAAVTADIENCEAAWTAAANVTATTNTSRKEGANSANLSIALGFTTGKAAHKALAAPLDLSAYQQVSLWFYCSAAVAAGAMRLALCSDASGDTPVTNLALPALGANAASAWVPVTVDSGAALPSGINSVALYCDSDPGAVTVRLDHIIACKAPSAADSLTLTSLIGKAHNLCWAASTAYALGDIRKPSQPNRNGYAYKVTTAGSTGAAEPTWPTAEGLTVADGSVVWECFQLEESWWPVMNISGTTVKLDQCDATPATATRGYSGATETVASYKREPLLHVAPGTSQGLSEDGGEFAPFVITGGWSRTDMSTQDGETWLDGGAGNTSATVLNMQDYNTLVNMSVARGGVGIRAEGGDVRHCQVVACKTGLERSNSYRRSRAFGCHFAANSGYGFYMGSYNQKAVIERTSICSNVSGGTGALDHASYGAKSWFVTASRITNNGGYGLDLADSCVEAVLRRVRTADNASGAFYSGRGHVTCFDSLLSEGLPAPATTFGTTDTEYRFHNSQKVLGAHVTNAAGVVIESATDQRNTPSGYSLKATISSGYRNSVSPFRFSLGKFLCQSGVARTFSAMMRRNSTLAGARLIVPEGGLRGIDADAKSADFAAAADTWATSGALTITTGETGVVELFAEVWTTDSGSPRVVWIDDLSVE